VAQRKNESAIERRRAFTTTAQAVDQGIPTTLRAAQRERRRFGWDLAYQAAYSKAALPKTLTTVFPKPIGELRPKDSLASLRRGKITECSEQQPTFELIAPR